ncbi:MAG: hypothetical protein A4E43_01379 [Methanosaeta sp. PtaB.Bin005]|nr:MAG: hypothetical protein A4E43_01379 [Methanosaeta sp. PtaB.Bin005]
MMIASMTFPRGELYLLSSSWGTVLASYCFAMVQILPAMIQAMQANPT